MMLATTLFAAILLSPLVLRRTAVTVSVKATKS